LRGIATLQREFDNLVDFQRLDLPAPAPLYFACPVAEGNRRAVLITEELGGFRSLEAWTEEWNRIGRPSGWIRQGWIATFAEIVRRMHEHRFQHNCLYAKHVFLRLADGRSDVCIIDLEKAKRRWPRRLAVYRDLDTLNRHTPGWPATDRLRFLKAYAQTESTAAIRPLWRALGRLKRKKSG
jgi:hypothetical protein